MFFEVEPQIINRLDRALNGAYERHERALRKFDDVVNALSAFEQSYPCRVVSETRYGMDSHDLVVTKVVPQSVMITVGELVHGLRSILDNMVYAFWVEDAADTAPPGAITRVDFPVGKKAKDFRLKLKSLGLASDIACMIEKLECYEGGIGEKIFRLSQLDNIDKHRLIPIAECKYAVSGFKNMVKNYDTLEHDVFEVEEVDLYVSSLHNGPSIITKYGYVYSSRPIVSKKDGLDWIDTGQVNTSITVFLSDPFPSHVNLLQTLHEWIWQVREILDASKRIAEQRAAS